MMLDLLESRPAVCATRGELMERVHSHPATLQVSTRVVTITEATDDTGQVIYRYEHELPRK